ncbi:MAG: signal peptide peptidase SppA [Porticoccus sp.]
MSDKPGLIRRFFRLIGGLLSVVRTLINIAFLLILVGLALSFIQGDVQPLPEQAALRVAPGGFLVEQKTYVNPLTQIMQQSSPSDAETLVSDLIEAIDRATHDNRITSLVLELDYLIGGGISKLEDIGDALARFKKSGKLIVAVGDNYTQEQYYLASYADEIHLNPMGTVLLTGYGNYPNYFKEALDKLHINLHIFRVGTYKDAIEPFTRNNMSAASREHTTEWLSTLWSVYTSRVETLRDLPADAINDYVNNLGQKLAGHDDDASALTVAMGLVDKLSTRPQMRIRLQQLAGINDEGDYLHINVDQYLGHLRRADALQLEPESSKIGLIVAKGMILDGEQHAGTVGGDSLAELFKQARDDTQVEALVLRIDSPGGSAFASEVIRQEVALTRQTGIPVIVSMGSVAASGGYWIAMGADQVWASPTTITGSIGVFGIIPTFEDSLTALGIHSDGVGTTTMADFFRLDRPMSPQAKEVIQSGVNHVYDRFLSLVAEARNRTPDEIHKVAQGRVWTGEKALALGLVDKLGSLQQAIVAAAEVAELDSYKVERIEPPLDFSEKLMQELAGGQVGVLVSALPEKWLPTSLVSSFYGLSKKLELLVNFNDPRGLYLNCFECMDQ